MLKRLKNNILLSTMGQIKSMLSASQKRRATVLGLLIILSAFLDVGGLAILIPVIMIGASPEIIQENEWLKWAFDGLGFESDISFRMMLIVGTVLFFILKNLFAFWLHKLQTRFAYDVSTSLAKRQYLKYYERGYAYFKDSNSSDIINNILNIPNFFAHGVMLNIIGILSELAVLIFVIVGISMVDILLFVALIGTLAPGFILLYWGTRNKMYELGQERKRLFVLAHSALNRAIFGYSDVKLSNNDNKFLHKYVDKQKRLNDNSGTRTVLNQLPRRSTEVVAVIGIAIIFAYALLLADKGEFLFAFLGVFAGAAYRVMPSMNRMLTALMGIKNNQFAVEVLLEGTLPEDETPIIVNPVSFESEIAIKDLTFSYPDANRPALNKVSFSVKKGEKIGIIGESGSGKTTLMNILLRFFEEDEGGIYIDGRKLDEEAINGWRKLIGYVQQDVYLMDGSLEENIAFGDEGAEVHRERLTHAIKQASLEKFISELPNGLKTPVGEMGAKLSGGQKQRIGIARALYKQAKVLVFDEATSALDMTTEKEITEAIDNLSDGETTIFVIAHRITTLSSCNRILELKDGEILGFHNYGELVAERLP